MKFGVQQQIRNSMTASSTKYEFFKIPDGGRPPFWKSSLAITQQPMLDFSEILRGKAVFHRISVMGQIYRRSIEHTFSRTLLSYVRLMAWAVHLSSVVYPWRCCTLGRDLNFSAIFLHRLIAQGLGLFVLKLWAKIRRDAGFVQVKYTGI